MKDLLDSHMHTIASGHAYSTMNDMIAAAKEKGLSLIAITEHASLMKGSCCEGYFRNLRVCPRRYGELYVLHGVELNILNGNGDVDFDDELLSELDVCVASIHGPCYQGEGKDENTEAYIRVMRDPYINIIGHPDDSRFPIDYERLVRAAKDTHTLLEVNCSSLSDTSWREGAADNYEEMLCWCKKYEAPVIIDSDAHIDTLVGEHKRAWDIIKKAGMPEKLIVNTDLDRYFEYINYGRR